jgi:hypothetical protein
VTIGVSSSDTSEGTAAPSGLTFTAGDWSTDQTVTVTGVNDSVVDGDIGYSILLAAAVSADVNYSGLDPADVPVTNVDDDAAGFVVGLINGPTTEGGGTATFTVVLTSEPTADVTVGVSSSDTSEGTVAPSSLTFTAGNWAVEQTVTVTGVDDAVDDGDIGYSIVLVAAVSADVNYSGLDPADVAVTNADDDAADITVGLINGPTTEGGGTATFTVVLTTEPTADVTIGVSSSDTSEGTVAPSSLTFTAGDWSVAQTVTVTGVNDSVVDGDIGYSILLAAAVSADVNYGGLNPADVPVTNVDDDAAGFVVGLINGPTTEGGGTATFTVVLTSEPTADVTVGVSSSDTSEGTVAPSTLTFTAGTWSTDQTVTVTGVDDAIDDGDTGYSILLAAAVSADVNYNGLDPVDVAVTNLDDDAAGFVVGLINGPTTEGGGTATFTVVLMSEPTADVTIGVSSSDTTEGTVAPSGLTFTAGDWSTEQTVTVTGVDDSVTDGDIVYTILLAAAVSADGTYGGLNPADVAVTNVDDDTAGFVVSGISGDTTEGGGTGTFTVRLTTQPTANVTIGVSSSDTTEGTVAPSSLTFTAGDWSTAQTVTVTGVDDSVIDGDIGFTIFVATAVSADVNYSGLDPADVAVTNVDDDVAGFVVGLINGPTTEGGGTATFTVELTSEPTDNVTIGMSSSDLFEGTVAPSSLTFTAGDWSVAQTVTVTGVDDAIDDGDTGYTILLAAAVSADGNYSGLDPADVAVTNLDDGDTAGFVVGLINGPTTEGGGTATFTVVLTSEPTADVTIGVSSSDTSEGTVAPSTLTFTAGTWSTDQTVTVTGVDDAVDDGDIGYSILLAAAVSSDGTYNGLDPADVAVTNEIGRASCRERVFTRV